MDKFKIVIKCLLFFVVGAIIFQALTILFVPKWVSKVDPATPRWKEFYEQEEGTIDVLLIGASDVGRGLSPITLWENYGITSFNLGTSNQSMAFSYYVIKEAIKYQDVKTIVLDMDCAFMKGNAPEGEYRKLFDNVKKGSVIIFNPKKAFENTAEISSMLKISKEKAEELTADFRYEVTSITHYEESAIDQSLFDKVYGEGIVKSEEEFKAKVADGIKESYV